MESKEVKYNIILGNLKKLFWIIAVNIAILCSIGIFGTYFSDCLSESGFFGDTVEQRMTYSGVAIDEDVWGARHYWYNWGVFFLFLTSVGRFVATIIVFIKKNFDV